MIGALMSSLRSGSWSSSRSGDPIQGFSSKAMDGEQRTCGRSVQVQDLASSWIKIYTYLYGKICRRYCIAQPQTSAHCILEDIFSLPLSCRQQTSWQKRVCPPAGLKKCQGHSICCMCSTCGSWIRLRNFNSPNSMCVSSGILCLTCRWLWFCNVLYSWGWKDIMMMVLSLRPEMKLNPVWLPKAWLIAVTRSSISLYFGLSY